VAVKVGVVALVSILAGGRPAEAQLTDAQGLITSWLQLGPFTNPFGCTGANGDLLTLHLAPSSIHCLFPEEGDEIEYDTKQASTTGYTGSLSAGGKPQWVAYSDGSIDGDLNMDGTTLGDRTDEMMYVVTYIENATNPPADQVVDLCIGSDDGVQVWVDSQLVWNNNACRGRAVCQDNVTVTLTPGFHRIAMGVWERAGGFGASLGLRQGGVPILDTDPNWFFWGTENPGMQQPATCNLLQRTAVSASDPSTCPPQTGGNLTVTISGNLPAGPDIPEVKEIVTGPLNATNLSIPAGAIPATITNIIPPGGPMVPVGSFQDSRVILERPVCGTGNGGVIHSDGGTPGDPLDDTYEVTNVGEDIWAVGDSFTYAYNKLQGNFDVSVHVASRTPTPGSRWGKHGIMARQDLSTRSKYTFTMDGVGDISTDADNNDDSTLQANRPTYGGGDNFEQGPYRWGDGTVDTDDYCDGNGLDNGDCLVVHHDYLRLRRVGSVFESYSRAAPADPWTLLGTNDWGAGAPAVVLVGLAVTSHSFDCANPIEIIFDQFDLGGATLAPATVDPLGVDVTWTNVARSAVSAGNLRYTITIPSGQVNFVGRAGNDPVLGSGSATILGPITDYGPFTNPDLPHAHNIGAACAGTAITNPVPGTLVIPGAGLDIWQTGDQFMFAYKEVTGDFSARVTITDRTFSSTSPGWGKHGIMARQDCSVRSRYSFIHDHDDQPTATHPTRMANRPTHGGADNFEITPPGVPPDHHANTLRLDRCGNEFIAYLLDEIGGFGGTPGEWLEVGRNTWLGNVPATVQLGLAVTSHDGCNVTTITFEDWEVQPTCDAPVSNLICVINASGGLDMTWTNPPGSNPAVAISIDVDGTEVTTVPGNSTSASLAASNFTPGVISKIDVRNSSGIAASCNYPPEVNQNGFIKNWLILGPFAQPGGAAPGLVEIAYDYLTDGVTTEMNIEPAAGLQVNPDYFNPADGSGLAASTGLMATPNRPEVNPNGIPTWFEHRNAIDTIDFNYDVFRSDLTNIMCYAATYVTVEEDTTVDLGIGSDDAIHVLIDGVEAHINNIPRSYRPLDTVQDTVAGVTLTAGCHLILVKVFEGGGEHGFRFRLQDSTALPVLPEAIGFTCGSTTGGFRRGDSDSSGAVNLTDAIRILNVLFLGIGEILCLDAADSDDSGAVNLTDAIRVLNVLFLGIGEIPLPGMADCGPDPTADDATCVSYPASC
jgi:hypothetical protein